MLIAALRQLRHGPLKSLAPFWLLLGRIYRFNISMFGSKFPVKQRIGAYGPFKLHPLFAFSDFAHWGGDHNRGFEKCIEEARGKKCVFDIGAHIGLVTLPLSKAVNAGKIYSFEPAEANRRLLNFHLKANRTNNVSVVEALVGKKDKAAVTFYEQSQATGMNSVVHPKTKGQYKEVTKEQVALDSLCKKMSLEPDLIKIDVEGAEIDVLEGAVKTLKSCKPIIFLSVHPSHIEALGRTIDELWAVIEKSGYRLTDIDGNKVSELKLDEYILTPR